MKKIGYFFLAMLPAILMLLVSVVIAIMGGVVMALLDVNDEDALMLIQIVTTSVTFLLGLIIFKLGMRDRTFGNPFKSFTRYTLPGTILISVGMMIVVNAVLILLSLAFPNAIESYNALIEESGLADMTVLSTIATVICAPFNEETLFRGITLRILHAGGYSFIAANFIQALFFGIIHLNLVQGVYAFALGMMLGYIYKKTRSLWGSILAHMLFNIMGTYGSSFINRFEDKPVFLVGYMAVSVISLFVGLHLIKIRKRRRRIDQE